jgi:hypothetical protein
MVDEAFREALFRDPGTVLADFEIETEDRAAVMNAISQNREGPRQDQGHALHAALIKRWAT